MQKYDSGKRPNQKSLKYWNSKKLPNLISRFYLKNLIHIKKQNLSWNLEYERKVPNKITDFKFMPKLRLKIKIKKLKN
jgi:hypothetical protein